MNTESNTKPAEKIVLALSGGLDSTTLLHFCCKQLQQEVFPVAFLYGQKHSIELRFAKEQVKILQKEGFKVHDLKIVDITFMKDLLIGSSALVDDQIEVPTMKEVIGQAQPITYVPYRNLIFLSIMLSYAEAKKASKVYYGAQAHDEYSGYWDTSMYFVNALNSVSALNRQNNIKIKAPFVSLSKFEEIVLGTIMSVDYSKTWTSYKVIDEENLIADITNPTSVDRIMAFAKTGNIKDPQKYDKPIDWDELFKKHKQDFDVEEILSRVELNS